MKRSANAFPAIPALAVVLLGGAAWMFWPWPGETPAGSAAGQRPVVPTIVGAEGASRADLKTPWNIEAPSLPPEPAPETDVPGAAESAASAPMADQEADALTGVDAASESAELASAPAANRLPASNAAVQNADGDRTPKAPDAAAGRTPGEFETGVQAALEQYRAGKRVEARTSLNEMLLHANSAEERTTLRRHLERIADEMIWSRERIEGDPLVDVYVVKPGDKLANIAKPYDVPYELILQLNGMSDPTKIRANQKLKILRGPFHARVYKSDFRLDLYAQDTFVKSFRVGLGGENPTPVGEWIVRTRMRNPTYFPSESAKDKRVIPPNDPANPLGGFWVSLEGTTGDAVGQVGFGIHGTNEPESIGKAASLGCVRMINEEVEIVFRVLMEGKSKVTTLP
ncbi:MAG: L,D-transpeptidase family protein [Phycisphaerales bacterium]|nr:L,D-transpeptidase family protein [Phycisphaerales bacterium]